MVFKPQILSHLWVDSPLSFSQVYMKCTCRFISFINLVLGTVKDQSRTWKRRRKISPPLEFLFMSVTWDRKFYLRNRDLKIVYYSPWSYGPPVASLSIWWKALSPPVWLMGSSTAQQLWIAWERVLLALFPEQSKIKWMLVFWYTEQNPTTPTLEKDNQPPGPAAGLDHPSQWALPWLLCMGWAGDNRGPDGAHSLALQRLGRGWLRALFSRMPAIWDKMSWAPFSREA